MHTVETAAAVSCKHSKTHGEYMFKIFSTIRPLPGEQKLFGELFLSPGNEGRSVKDMILAAWPIDRDYVPIVMAYK
jgi:hypothetical protein